MNKQYTNGKKKGQQNKNKKNMLNVTNNQGNVNSSNELLVIT